MLKSNKLTAISALVKDEIRERRWSHVQLATQMQMHGRFHLVYEFLDAKREIDAELAEGLAKAFGVRAEWWLSLNDLLKAANIESEVLALC
jgi:plasmid maintenance system antidote protein VapI